MTMIIRIMLMMNVTIVMMITMLIIMLIQVDDNQAMAVAKLTRMMRQL